MPWPPRGEITLPAAPRHEAEALTGWASDTTPADTKATSTWFTGGGARGKAAPSRPSAKWLQFPPALPSASLPELSTAGVTTGIHLQGEVTRTCCAPKEGGSETAGPSHRNEEAEGSPAPGSGTRTFERVTPAQKEPHQVDGVEDLHLSDGRTARVRQVTVVVVYRQRTQACGNTRRPRRVRTRGFSVPLLDRSWHLRNKERTQQRGP